MKDTALTDSAAPSRLFDRPLRAFRQNPQLGVVVFVGVVIAYLSLSPTLMLFYGSFRSKPLGVPGEFTLAHYISAYSDPLTYQLLFNSFVFAGGSALLATALAATLAWISIRTNAPLRRLFEITAIVPNIFPPVMLAVSWTVLLSPRTGLINRSFMQIFDLSEAPLNLYSLWGMVYVEALITVPLAFLMVSAALYSMDPALEESARVAGSSNMQIAWRITLPIVRPALLASAMLNFVRAIESFDTPAIIALPARIEVFTTKIYREAIGAFPPNQNLAAAYGVSLLLITMFFVYFYRHLTARSERYVTVTGRGYRPMIIDLGKWRYAASALAGLILVLIVVLPSLVMIYVSFITYVHVPSAKTWELLTLDNYITNLSDTRTYRALQNSLFLAVVGATVCMFLAALTAWVTTKTKTVGRGVIEALTFIPLGVSRHRLGDRLALDLRVYPAADLRHVVDSDDRLRHTVFALWFTHHDQHHRAIARRLAAGVDGLRGEFPDYFPAHSFAVVAARIYCRLDTFGVDLSARVQHLGLSLFPGSRTVGAVALSLLRRRQFGAHVFLGLGGELGVHDADLDRPPDRQSRRRL